MMPLIHAEAVSKRFGGLVAVDGVDLAVEEGEIRALIGPNGAGKTTLLNLLSGVYRPSAGQVWFEGREITGLAPHLVAVLGMARTFQNVRLFGEMSVLDNVKVGQTCRSRIGLLAVMAGLPRSRREEQRIIERAESCLAMVGLSEKALTQARSLPYGQQRLLEVARALATEPRLLLLDEPVAGLNAQEAGELSALIRKLRAGGLTILLIEHNMRFVMAIADRVTVLDFGRKIAEGQPVEVQDDPAVIEAYLGKD